MVKDASADGAEKRDFGSGLHMEADQRGECWNYCLPVTRPEAVVVLRDPGPDDQTSNFDWEKTYSGLLSISRFLDQS